MKWAIVIVLVAGCYDSGTVACGDLLCPHGSVCAPEEDRCVTPNQITACAGFAEGAGCSAGTIAGGVCHRQVCIEAGCGNSVVEAGELCDDGNRFSLDGCSSDCRSNERCGNGVVDIALGEQCDCGDATVAAGCERANSENAGAECRTNCKTGRCGDGVVDPGEWCDDGNTAPGDGCRADCTGRFTLMPSGTLHKLNDVWGRSPDDVWAVGEQRILHFDGVLWHLVEPPALNSIYQQVCGTGPTTLYVKAYGSSPIIYRLEGSTWSTLAMPTTPSPHVPGSIACAGSDLIIGNVGTSPVFVDVWNGTSFSSLPTTTTQIAAMSARSRNDIYALLLSSGDTMAVRYFNGAAWIDAGYSVTSLYGKDILALSDGSAFTYSPVYRFTDAWRVQPLADDISASTVAGVPGDVILAGATPKIDFAAAAMRFDGTAWSLLPMPDLPGVRINGAWVASPGHAFLVGDSGTILY
ncbi:MAG TPA: DUF4215 domain-containing protein [Kofleriaceae bacterium]|nr:DUF4215 domain-containing protein [Kofleriaceae bacterium]